MSNKIRIAALVVAFIAAGCVGSNEANQVMNPVSVAAAETRPIFSDMHAAIPASKTNGNVFEY